MLREFIKLLEPLKIGKVRLRNRIVKPAQAMALPDIIGYVSERTKFFYEALAKGGVGMIIIEACGTDYPRCGSGSYKRLLIDDDKFIPGLSELSQCIHKHGCPTFVQLGYAGTAAPKRISGLQPIAASSLNKGELPNPALDEPRGLNVIEIEQIVEKFAKAAGRASKAGFDGVEVHACHAYLINSFLSRAWNKRRDAYGAQSLGNRARFAVEIIKTIKQQVGQDFPVGIRINGVEYGVENGITAEESRGISQILQQAGADYIHVSGYGYGPYIYLSFPEQLLYPEPAKELNQFTKTIKKPGAFVPAAEAIKKRISIPVIVAGRLSPVLGEWLLQEDKVDLIALGRSLFADPELPNKISSGRLEDVRPCTACFSCLSHYRSGEPVACRVNAALGKNHDYNIELAAVKKRVMVVGAGPAGMEAARVAALRGHEVTLYERGHKLGGLLDLAALLKGTEIEDLPAIVRYFKNQINKLDVKVRLTEDINPRLIEEIKPDVLIVAIGGTSRVPKISGIDRRNVFSSAALHHRAKFWLRFLSPRILRWLTKIYLPIGKTVVVLGGSIHGCEVAEFIVKRGREVTIVETSDQLGTGMVELNRTRLLSWLAKKGVVMLTGVKYEEVTDKGLILIKEGKRQIIEADAILIALPPEPNTSLAKALEGKVPEIYTIGDGKKPGDIENAINDGWSVGLAI